MLQSEGTWSRHQGHVHVPQEVLKSGRRARRSGCRCRDGCLHRGGPRGCSVPLLEVRPKLLVNCEKVLLVDVCRLRGPDIGVPVFVEERDDVRDSLQRRHYATRAKHEEALDGALVTQVCRVSLMQVLQSEWSWGRHQGQVHVPQEFLDGGRRPRRQHCRLKTGLLSVCRCQGRLLRFVLL